jgi:phospholipid transport system substrate-binding protein
MKPLTLSSVLFLFVGFCGILSSARAAPPSEDPSPILLATINSVIDLALGQPPAVIQDRIPQIQAKMSEVFSIEAIVKRAFGRNWSKLNPTQQTEAIDLLSRLITRTYATQLSTGERPVITISPSHEIGSDRREITSTASQHGQTVNVVYRLGIIDGKWKVYDVLAEGVSIVGNYRQQFDAHFEKKSAAELIDLLKAKLAAPPAPPPAPEKKS